MKRGTLDLLQLKVYTSPAFLYFSILNFKTLFLLLEIGLKFNAWPNESNTKCSFVEIITRWKLWHPHAITAWKSIHYSAFCLQIPLSTTVKSITFADYGTDETRTQNPLFPRGKRDELGFHLGIEVFCVWVSSLPWKKQLLKIWTNLKFVNFSEKARPVVVSRAKQGVIPITWRSNIQTYSIYLTAFFLSGNIEGGCLG